MTTQRDAYWDELGVAWCATNPDSNVIAPRLHARLRRQSLLITAGIVAAVPLCIACLLLGVFTIWSGLSTGAWNFVTRGIAIEAITALLAVAVLQQLPVRANAAAGAVSALLDLAIARAQRTLLAIRLGFFACSIAAMFGLLGTAIRTYQGNPPQLSPLVDLVLLALFALGLFVYGRSLRVTHAKLRALKYALGMKGDEQ